MNRRRTLAALAVLGVAPGALLAQGRVPTVGLLWIEAAKPSPYLSALLEGLGDYGYLPGRNIRIEERFLVAEYQQLATAAERLVAQKPDVIVTVGGTAIQAARKATATLPIVMIAGGDPVKLGMVKSLARPGGNVTGFTIIGSELAGKRIELLKEAFPTIRRIAIALYPESEGERIALANLTAAAQSVGWRSSSVEIRSADEIEPVVAQVARSGADALVVAGSTLLRANRSRLVAAIGKTRLPAIYADSLFVYEGGLLSYGPNLSDALRRGAAYIARILKGAKPADLPVEQASRMELMVNARTAKQQGIELPRSLLLRADRVID